MSGPVACVIVTMFVISPPPGGREWRGIGRARTPVEFDPLRGDGDEKRMAGWGEEAGISLFPVGSLESGRFCLGISETGEIFLVEAWLASFGVGDAALENLILGVAPVKVDAG
jgi:hypothetical protein